MTAAFTVEHGQVAVSSRSTTARRSASASTLPLHGTRHEALEPVRQGVTERFGGVAKEAAAGLGTLGADLMSFSVTGLFNGISGFYGTVQAGVAAYDGLMGMPNVGTNATNLGAGYDAMGNSTGGYASDSGTGLDSGVGGLY